MSARGLYNEMCCTGSHIVVVALDLLNSFQKEGIVFPPCYGYRQGHRLFCTPGYGHFKLVWLFRFLYENE